VKNEVFNIHNTIYFYLPKISYWPCIGKSESLSKLTV